MVKTFQLMPKPVRFEQKEFSREKAKLSILSGSKLVMVVIQLETPIEK